MCCAKCENKAQEGIEKLSGECQSCPLHILLDLLESPLPRKENQNMQTQNQKKKQKN
jgi:hypothetical protein